MSNEILVFDAIGPAWAGMVDDVSFLEQLSSFGGAPVTVRVNSPGGDVFMANAIYNAIERYPGRVTVSVEALAASAASYFILAADEVVASKNSMIMIHKPLAMTWGNAKAHQKTIDILDKAESTLVGMYAERTKRSVDEITSALEAETWFTAEEAKEWGLVDRVGLVSDYTAKVPDGMFSKTPTNLLSKPVLRSQRQGVDVAKAQSWKLRTQIS